MQIFVLVTRHCLDTRNIPIGFYHGVALGSVAIRAVHLLASADLASLLVELTQGVPMLPLMPSQMTSGEPPQGLVTLKFLKRMLEQTALGLHVRRPTARPYLPDVVPEKFSKVMLVMLTRDG